MTARLKLYRDVVKNMGWRYVFFRLWYEFQRNAGLLVLRYPSATTFYHFVSLADWKKLPVRFFFEGRPSAKQFYNLQNSSEAGTALRGRVRRWEDGEVLFFNAVWYRVEGWLTNPVSHYKYDIKKHWSRIPDFSREHGDIKLVWEKSRFCFVYDLIRYDLHFAEDKSDMVFSAIDSWIAENPVNYGPNWRCSQEISLRVLNWTFALHYYKDSPHLDDQRFTRIANSIFHQMHHVRKNINFSRIAVRNNHVLTESLALYLTGTLYPFFPDSDRWKRDGKRWFEEEVAYQVYDDGSYLQFSMNYHRVVVQLLGWAIRLADLNGDGWSESLLAKARKSLRFLRAAQNDSTGWLPNYGNNDGTLFFPLSEAHFRDFRPQLAALATILGEPVTYKSGVWEEEALWLAGDHASKSDERVSDVPEVNSFDSGGFYIMKDLDAITFIRCGFYRDRPFQADNLHLDLQVGAVNILRDAGTYSYNGDRGMLDFFGGSIGHNTVKIGPHDQMYRGPRFIWTDWIRRAEGDWVKDGEDYVFSGWFEGFPGAGKNIRHHRKVKKTTGKHIWLIEDSILNADAGVAMHQIWHPAASFFQNFTLRAWDKKGIELTAEAKEGWYAEKYGIKVQAPYFVFSSLGGFIRTEISAVTV